LSIVLFEIDENQHPAQAGETAEAAILEETAALLLGSIRDSDYAGRYGQKSFLIIYSWTGLKDAYVISERIRKKIEGHFFQSGSGISVSGGVCEYRG
jgi:two-component system cell cycle response regulator